MAVRSDLPRLIGAIHLLPLPGSPRWAGSMAEVCEAAAADANAYAEGGFDALVVENFGDVPFTRATVAAETVAAMALAAQALTEAGRGLLIGFNVLRNDADAALGLCAACGGDFVRINVHSGAMVTDQGIIEGDAFTTLRKRAALCPRVRIFADVQVKHAAPLGAIPLEQTARDTFERGKADALIVSGSGTGEATSLDDLRRVRQACPEAPLLVGSGATAATAGELLGIADGLIVGSALKAGGVLSAPVDVERVRAFCEAAAQGG
jgi:membrane complex biogenesis BtpA family protein